MRARTVGLYLGLVLVAGSGTAGESPFDQLASQPASSLEMGLHLLKDWLHEYAEKDPSYERLYANVRGDELVLDARPHRRATGRDEAKDICVELFVDLRSIGQVDLNTGEVTGSAPWGGRRSSHYASFFGFRAGTSDVSELLPEIDRRTRLEIRVETDGGGTARCTGPLLGTHADFEYQETTERIKARYMEASRPSLGVETEALQEMLDGATAATPYLTGARVRATAEGISVHVRPRYRAAGRDEALEACRYAFLQLREVAGVDPFNGSPLEGASSFGRLLAPADVLEAEAPADDPLAPASIASRIDRLIRLSASVRLRSGGSVGCVARLVGPGLDVEESGGSSYYIWR